MPTQQMLATFLRHFSATVLLTMMAESVFKKFHGILHHLTHETVNGKEQKRALKWGNIIFLFIAHVITTYALLFGWRHCDYPIRTYVILFLHFYTTGVGVTAGVHRLWSHRSYKAKLPLRIILAMLFSMAGQNTIPQWVLDHRVHHRYTEQDADPHNAARGFFFSHVGWLMQEKGDAVKKLGKTLDISDVLADPVVKYHTMFFIPLKLMLAFILPMSMPAYLWGENGTASMLMGFGGNIAALNVVWSVNSFAHLYGSRPYDKRLGPVENLLVSLIAVGEGWHNYHHVFPWDYKASEYGVRPNTTTAIIHFFARIGWAYDLKSPSQKWVDEISAKYGDGSRHTFEVKAPVNKRGGPEVRYIGEEEEELKSE